MSTSQETKGPREPRPALFKVIGGLLRQVHLKRALIAGIIAISVLGSVAALALPFLIQQAIDIITEGRPLEELMTITVLFFLFTFLEAGLTMVNNYAMQILGIETMYAVRNRMFSHLQRLGFSYYHTHKTGRIISYLTNDVDAVQNLLTSGLVNLIVQFFRLCGSLVIMLLLSLEMSISLLISIPLNFVFMVVFSRRSVTHSMKIRSTVAKMTAQTVENIDGLRTIKSHRTEKFMISKYEKTVLAERDVNQKAATLWSIIPAVNMFVTYVTVGLTIIWGGFLHFMGNIPVGLIFGYVLYLLLFFQPLGTIANMFASIQNASVGGARVLRLLGTEPDLKESPGAKNPHKLKGMIAFENVHFSYIDEEKVLDNISLDVKKGERLAIVGPTGAGKSTLISLIPRFYDVKQGRIAIDDVDVRDYKFDAIRRNIGMVLQDNFLFADTILENIRYGKLGASDDEVIEASKQAGAHPFIDAFPDGYKTRVGERGAILSIGQRQLIAFARALLADPPILILDEATSSVDAYSEILIQKSLDSILRNRTSIIIAHRLSTIVNSDTIIVLDEGKIIQKGNHASLMQDMNGLYYKLYRMQFAESESTGVDKK